MCEECDSDRPLAQSYAYWTPKRQSPGLTVTEATSSGGKPAAEEPVHLAERN